MMDGRRGKEKKRGGESEVDLIVPADRGGACATACGVRTLKKL